VQRHRLVLSTLESARVGDRSVGDAPDGQDSPMHFRDETDAVVGSGFTVALGVRSGGAWTWPM
jgi:hypothetical protein